MYVCMYVYILYNIFIHIYIAHNITYITVYVYVHTYIYCTIYICICICIYTLQLRVSVSVIVQTCAIQTCMAHDKRVPYSWHTLPPLFEEKYVAACHSTNWNSCPQAYPSTLFDTADIPFNTLWAKKMEQHVIARTKPLSFDRALTKPLS